MLSGVSKMIDRMSRDDCVGCGLCASVCDRQAIAMQPDERTGFLYPFIDESKCTNCKNCQARCPVVVKRNSCELKTQSTISPKCFDTVLVVLESQSQAEELREHLLSLT